MNSTIQDLKIEEREEARRALTKEKILKRLSAVPTRSMQAFDGVAKSMELGDALLMKWMFKLQQNMIAIEEAHPGLTVKELDHLIRVGDVGIERTLYELCIDEVRG